MADTDSTTAKLAGANAAVLSAALIARHGVDPDLAREAARIAAARLTNIAVWGPEKLADEQRALSERAGWVETREEAVDAGLTMLARGMAAMQAQASAAGWSALPAGELASRLTPRTQSRGREDRAADRERLPYVKTLKIPDSATADAAVSLARRDKEIVEAAHDQQCAEGQACRATPPRVARHCRDALGYRRGNTGFLSIAGRGNVEPLSTEFQRSFRLTLRRVRLRTRGQCRNGQTLGGGKRQPSIPPLGANATLLAR